LLYSQQNTSRVPDKADTDCGVVQSQEPVWIVQKWNYSPKGTACMVKLFMEAGKPDNKLYGFGLFISTCSSEI
jgi:hypothetical protein